MLSSSYNSDCDESEVSGPDSNDSGHGFHLSLADDDNNNANNIINNRINSESADQECHTENNGSIDVNKSRTDDVSSSDNELNSNDESNPQEDWPIYAVDLKGSAKIYSRGLHEVDRLQRESHVFTVKEGQTVKDIEK
ncbi:hypothetical protein HCN44_001328 [Aphidius gifuensis]|uniref:Uncharacterized protein n=1 Tax=Aphidius gifuensis TaxID=684658 RepID=A0A834XJH9_APHGI|nr:hypothetical protein HCN44_001328 [Aphidius gifuensis]